MSERNPSAVDNEAAAWVSRMDSGNWSPDAERQLQCWLREDVRHQGALLQAEAAWMSVDLCRAQAQSGDKRLLTPLTKLLDRRHIVAAGLAGIAASVAAGLGLLPRGNIYQTVKGEMSRLPLSDGSIVAINTDSKLVIRLQDRKRQIHIERGEAWFQVAKDRSRPFVVQAGEATVVALGTAFSVRRRAEGADILVTEGLVQAFSHGHADQALFLAAGQRALLRNAVLERVPATAASVDQVLAWRDGRIDLAGERLGDAVDEFNRFNRRQMVLVDPALAGEQLDGLFRTDDVEGFARAVHGTLGIPISTGAEGEIIIGKAQTS